MTPLDHALYYASRGWRIHPIPPGYKYPAGAPKWQENATTDADRIRKYYGLNPDHGVCIATGPESGVFAIDIDPDDGGDDSLRALEAKYGPLPETIESLTGGGGRHLLFAWPEGHEIRNSASGVLGVGIDVRGVGGQIVVAPTVHPETGCEYAWEVEHDPFDGVAPSPAPEWLLELLSTPPGTAQPRRERIERPSGAEMMPGDWWAARTTWADELARADWTLHSTHTDARGSYYEMWTRPGKTVREGASASLYWQGSDVLKVFTSNAAPLQAEATYTLWGFHVATAHGGDWAAAARAVRSTMPRVAPETSNSTPGSVAPLVEDASEVAPKTEEEKRAERRRRRIAAAAAGPRPMIVHNGRQHDEVVADAIDAIQLANTPPVMFVRAGQLTRLREDEGERPLIESLRSEHVRLVLSQSATWWRSNKDGELTATAPPLDVAASVLATGSWPLPSLAGVVELPVLRPDGTFHTEHGHDRSTGLYHWHRGPAYPPIPEQPTDDELTAAVAFVEELFADFPWDTGADKANAWALLLTPLVRAVIGQVPMALIDAPEPGTGKGLLVKVCSIVTTGHAAALMAWPTSDEELEKKVSATLMAGNTVVVFDNVEGMIKSPTLAAVLTADAWQGRILGRSELVVVPNRATWAATGNNIDVGGDLARRCYRIRLDARQAQPWLRTGWRHSDLEGWALEHRSELLHALCTIVRSWWAAGRPSAVELPAMGGYASWVRTIGGILQHAGVGHFLANLAEFHAEADREAQSWEAFLGAWSDQVGEQAMTVTELIARMSDVQYGTWLREVLPEDLSGYWDTTGFARRFGLALRKRTGRHFGPDGLHIVELPRDRRKVAIYSVTNRSAQLFDPAESAGVAREDGELPRYENAVSRDDGIEARECGSAGPISREEIVIHSPVDDEKNVAPSWAENSRVPRTPAVDDDGGLF